MSAGGIDALEWEERAFERRRPRRAPGCAPRPIRSRAAPRRPCCASSPAHSRICRGHDVFRHGRACPGSSPPSTSWPGERDVDARHEAGHDELQIRIRRNTSVTGTPPWPSSSPKNNPCCATARAALSAARRRCRICGSFAIAGTRWGFPATCGARSPKWVFPDCWCRKISAAADLAASKPAW